jgi:hypothetical protein
MNKPEQPAPNRFQPQGKTKLIKGSILQPENAGLRFVLSINNTLGKVEGNPLLPLFDRKWKQVRQETKGWFANKTGAYKLGAISTTAVQSDTWVVNMLCQGDDLKVDDAGLQECLKQVSSVAKYEKATVHVSTILTTAIPNLVEYLTKQLLEAGVSVYYYDEP